jgi:hypothetical protein
MIDVTKSDIKKEIYYFPIIGTAVYKYEIRGEELISTNYLVPDVHLEGICFWDLADEAIDGDTNEKIISIIPAPPECYYVACDYKLDGKVIGKTLGIE